MYFPDLSPFRYHGGAYDGILNVGWLDDEHPFAIGEHSKEFIEALRLLSAKPVRLTRGFHVCPFCSDPRARGSAEIEVSGENGRRYAAPTLIVHYIEDHKYLPPSEFISAVVASSQ
jgi:hypothetical protein